MEVGAERLEIAHVQYHGWALQNRSALLPTRAQVEAALQLVTESRERLSGRLSIDYVPPDNVPPDYYARRPKACMGGWGRRFLVITPMGFALPCHAARTLPGLRFPSVAESTLAWIWRDSPAFARFRGTDWMRDPCRSCDRREVDWGGCRCQALALTGDAANADPACELSPHHGELVALAAREAEVPAAAYRYRGFATRGHGRGTPGVSKENQSTGCASRDMGDASF